MEAPIDEGLLTTVFVESFSDHARSPYGAVLSTLLTKEDLSWRELPSQMLQEYGSHPSSRCAEDSGREKAFMITHKKTAIRR